MLKNVIAQNHWQQYFDDLNCSSKEFYEKLKKLIEDYKFPNVSISISKYSEGGMLSAKREYLTIKRGNHKFDCCAAPFGKSFFVSWWLTELEGGCLPALQGIPILGRLLGNAATKTFYQVDTETMFAASIHSLITKVIEGLVPEHGSRLPKGWNTFPENMD